MDLNSLWAGVSAILFILFLVWILSGRPSSDEIFFALLSPLQKIDDASDVIRRVASNPSDLLLYQLTTPFPCVALKSYLSLSIAAGLTLSTAIAQPTSSGASSNQGTLFESQSDGIAGRAVSGIGDGIPDVLIGAPSALPDQRIRPDLVIALGMLAIMEFRRNTRLIRPMIQLSILEKA